MLTVGLLTIVVYIYTVIAFNFFRKFYVSEEEEEVDQKCHDMLTVSDQQGALSECSLIYEVYVKRCIHHFPETRSGEIINWHALPLILQCFVFHLYKGVRAGGGIGDEIEPPDGDANEVRTLLSVLLSP